MKKELKELGDIYESNIINKQNTLASKIGEDFDWLLELEDVEEAEDYCNEAFTPIGMGRDSIAYEHNGVILKLSGRDRGEWEPYINLPCFAKTELYNAEFGLVIVQEELRLDSSEFCENDIESEIEACLKASNVPYDRREITDENVGLNDLGEWKLFDIPIN